MKADDHQTQLDLNTKTFKPLKSDLTPDESTDHTYPQEANNYK